MELLKSGGVSVVNGGYRVSCTYRVKGDISSFLHSFRKRRIYLNSHMFLRSKFVPRREFIRSKNQSHRDILDVTTLKRETGSILRETCLGFTLSPSNLTWTGLESNSSLCGERQATNYLSQGTANVLYSS